MQLILMTIGAFLLLFGLAGLFCKLVFGWTFKEFIDHLIGSFF